MCSILVPESLAGTMVRVVKAPGQGGAYSVSPQVRHVRPYRLPNHSSHLRFKVSGPVRSGAAVPRAYASTMQLAQEPDADGCRELRVWFATEEDGMVRTELRLMSIRITAIFSFLLQHNHGAAPTAAAADTG
jgi:hypothetical protein